MKKKILLTVPNANKKIKISYWKLALKINHFNVIGVYQWKNRIRPNFFEKFFEKIKIPFDISGFNKRIIKAAKNNPDLDFMLIEKGWYIYLNTLEKVRCFCPKIKIVYFSNDNMCLFHNTNFYLHQIFKSRIIDKINLINIPYYKNFNKFYQSNIEYTNKAYSEKFHFKKINRQQHYKYDVSFIGTFSEERLKTLLYLIKYGIKINVWGYGWEKYKNQFEHNLRVHDYEIYNNKYVKTIRESRINISFLRKINFDTQTSRTAEIPAAGGFLLTEDSFNHREIFGNLSKKILFNSNKDLLKKINFYLKNTKNRKSTAQRTQKVILNIIPSYEKKIENLLKTKTYYPYVNFLSKPRFNLMKTYYTLIHIIKKKYYTKTFDNFKECQNFCKKKIRECYDNYNLNYYRYNEFIFNSRKIHMLKSKGFNILKKIVMKNNKNNKILEIGGGFGADYLNLKKILKLKLNYTIMETKSIVNIMKDKSYCDFFTFNKNIFKKNFDIVYSSSSLQYFSNPELVYRLIFQSFPKYIILVNNNFSYNPKSISQYSCYSQNLASKARYRIQSEKISNLGMIYPNTQISEIKLKDTAKEFKYKISIETKGNENFGSDSYSKSFVFERVNQ